MMLQIIREEIIMRNRRMVSRTISTSEKVNSVSWEARLLFTWAILHCDDEGRMQGSPATIKAVVFPMADCSTAEITKWLKELKKKGIIRWYRINKCLFLQIEQWDCFQTFHGIRRNISKYPLPPPHRKRCTSTPSLETSKVKSNKESKVNKEKKKEVFSNLKNIGKRLEAGYDDK